ncbi:PadR family transcriptional regulator [Streptomyces avermitilis]|uniref:PadR family transcriptional regulator n=1 Tax=Streptomyces avermitilis TaxID=33903 RepID=A0A4D4M523_STRAX|nr:PadR family transcriptional regulator [Streptomyces avermitilis]KUN53740.1 PadR family transcriptional regulator [Streptomyces avermitilis]OOV27265.1 PadR family transcriptional regulator [Streptomyces avermitilis]BBJ54983.1 PadR family transcriptional regulator [Streptomyces avermitilis]GDY66970.1 PadR family transcriptional regulator [Streptomyces avermitilis]GDY72768.1 PadR family transcriptional regulator [Streptomyces avermitilis]
MGTKRRKLGNPLALAVMVLLMEKPMHPYEIAQTLRRRGKDTTTKINYGSLYTVVQNLEKHGFVEVAEVQRQGNRPERTLYGITDAGREEATEWLSDLLAVPAREYPIFETALSLLGVLHPDEVTRLLEERLTQLEVQVASARGGLEKLYETLPRLFLVETEYQLHMVEAQAEWVRGFLRELHDGSLAGVEAWRRFHETGEIPPEFKDLEERHFEK